MVDVSPWLEGLELVRAPGHPKWDGPQGHQGEVKGSSWAEVHSYILAVPAKI